MKVWVTKYAMSRKGLIPCEEANGTCFDDTVVVRAKNGQTICDWYIHKPYWHTSPESAIARAEEMRTKKIASLKKQIAKLEEMTFSAE